MVLYPIRISKPVEMELAFCPRILGFLPCEDLASHPHSREKNLPLFPEDKLRSRAVVSAQCESLQFRQMAWPLS